MDVMERSTIDFDQMKKEASFIASDLDIPDFEVGSTLKESPVRDSAKDILELTDEIHRRENNIKTRESLGQIGQDLDEITVEKIGELSSILGEKFDLQRPEIKAAIAKLPKSGVGLKENEEGEVEGEQEINPENIAFVRITDYLPAEKDGARKVLTAFEATKEADDPTYRLTTHWTVNHVVHSHNLGGFDGRRVVIIVPGQSMLRENGAPDSMLPVDTFWHKSITLPENAVTFSYDEDPSEKSIQLAEGDDSEAIALLSLEAMGYTTVNDSPTYTETGFDDGVYQLGERMGIKESMLHTDMRTEETAIENFFHPPLGGENVADALERMACQYWTGLPEEIKKAAIKRLEETVVSDISPEEKHITYDALRSIILDFDERYATETKKPFICSLTYSILLDCIMSEAQLWIDKDDANPKEMVEEYIKPLSLYLPPDMISKLREGAKQGLGL